jgi:SAM-dependent methyltransferase
MRQDIQQNRAKTGDSYWWSCRRRARILKLLRHPRFAPVANARGLAAIDVGCGTGELVNALQRAKRPAYGCDIDFFALRLTSAKVSSPLVNCDSARLPFADACTPLVIAMDVLEHTEVDRDMLGEVMRVLTPGGTLVLTVPAHQALWTSRDVVAGHFRRYSKRRLLEVLRGSGLQLLHVQATDFFIAPILFILSALERLAPRASRDSARKADGFHYDKFAMSLPGWISSLLYALLTLEDHTLSRSGMIWGSSFMLVARKPLA